MKNVRSSSGFTLIELLVVIAIIAILTGLAVPAIKNLGRSNILTSSSRQLLDDIGRARQLAVTHRTTVYMVFVPTNFWTLNVNWWSALTPAQKTVVTNLFGMQLCGYNFLSIGDVGDQPGNHVLNYLSSWQSMPEGSYIAASKFCEMPPGAPTYIQPWDQDYHNGNKTAISCFVNFGVPFPTADSNLTEIHLPMPSIAFDYTGRLVSEPNGNGGYNDAYIPLTQGSVLPARDGSTKMLQFASPSILESPPGNTTNISYNVIHIDALTGRAQLEYHKVQ